MRFKLGGADSAPDFGLDGFFFKLATSRLELAAGGTYSDRVEGDLRIKELSLSGGGKLKLKGGEYRFGLDLLHGDVEPATPASGAVQFSYYLIHAFVAGRITIGSLELTSLRFLLTDEMRPAPTTADRSSPNVPALCNWYKHSDPLQVGADRRLSAWERSPDTQCLGLG